MIKAQNYKLYKAQALSKIDRYKPVILYGIEFIFSRDPLKYSKGENKEKGVNGFVAKVTQDADKLITSKNMEGFMGQIKMLTFVKGSSKKINSLLTAKLSLRNEIILCFGE